MPDDPMNDESFLGYCDIHSRTPRALFSWEHAVRLHELAGESVMRGGAGDHPAFVAIPAHMADPLIEAARERLGQRQPSRREYRALVRHYEAVLCNPEKYHINDVRRATGWAQELTAELMQATGIAVDVTRQLEDPESEWRQEMDALRDRMHAGLDALNDSIGQVEEAMRSKYVGRAAAIELFDDYALFWWQWEGEWGLWVMNNRGHVTRLHRCAKKHRLVAAGLIPELVHQLKYEDE